MVAKRHDYYLTPIKRLAKYFGKLLFWLGRPFYFLFETAGILSIVLSYQIGQILIRRIPFILIFLRLSTQLTFLKLKYYFLQFMKYPRLPSLLRIIEKLTVSIRTFHPTLRHIANTVRTTLPKAPKVPFPPLPTRVKLVGFGLAIGGIFCISFWFYILRDLPSPDELTLKPRPLSTHILDRNGELLFKIYRTQNRTIVPISEIPLFVQQATIAVEDAEFYTHSGFSLRGILRAVERNLAQGELVGGSTITQQLVKNVLLTPEKTLKRKVKEIILAFLVEMQFSKREILEMYLNEVSYGGTAYGIEEATQLYFGKRAGEMDLAEAAILAGLPAAPSHFSPFGATPHLARERQRLVLARMAEEGFITEQQKENAEKEELTFAPLKLPIRAPHFVMYVRQFLAEKYGERLVEEGGLTVVTSLDLSTQQEAERVVREEIDKLAPLHVTNGATLVTSAKTGEILAMVGSKDYFDSREGNFNVTTAARQPGSSIKPVNYAYALSHGYTPATIVEDSPVTYIVPGQPPYSPENYDRTFKGKLPLRTALGSSLNVPAVKVLASYGVSNMVEQGTRMGVTTWNDSSRFGLSLTLGGGEVKMTDMAVVYGTLANYGKRVDLHPILKVTDSNGRILEEFNCQVKQVNLVQSLTRSIHSITQLIKPAHAAVANENSQCEGEQVLDQRVAFLLTDILHDNNARIPAFGANSLLVIPEHSEVAVKTGTTQNLRDNWANGYTKDYVVLAWVGNNDNSPMSYVASGVTGATPIWHNIMRYLLEGKPNHPWEVPAGVVKVQVCPFTGTLPCEGCPTREEYFLEETQPKNQCNLGPIIEEIEREEKQNRLLERLRERREGNR
ncbi:transglycosylase domain-containing protein [Candidatus Microgenomates bacterium]|nr:transglycosylase domain-containing protein [Candidatus Microgenomates bacterium]